jgi:hypothetical protein
VLIDDLNGYFRGIGCFEGLSHQSLDIVTLLHGWFRGIVSNLSHQSLDIVTLLHCWFRGIASDNPIQRQCHPDKVLDYIFDQLVHFRISAKLGIIGYVGAERANL